MSVRGVLIMLALLLAPAGPVAAQGFAGLGESGDGYAAVEPGKPVVFPRDHGAHPQYRIEWWYLTANLHDAEGQDFGLQWTLFRQASAPEAGATGWDSVQVWLGHAALTSAERHIHAETFARGGIGQAGARAEPFSAWIDDWALSSTGAAFAPLTVRAAGPDFAYDLTLDTDRPMVRQGQDGYSVKSDAGQASYYVSQPFFTASGWIELSGVRHTVEGSAWMDREWSSRPLAADQTGWDWFSLHLDSGEKVMLFRLRDSAGGAFLSGNWITPEGTSSPIRREDIRLVPLATASVAGREVPVEWRVVVEGRDLDVVARALNAQSWNDGFVPYWEGPVFLSGSHAGRGYLEMTGYQP